jgi:2-polyprenyl-6-methoxyphenol hydroxylase-like FAD-dependent oxidoreductase
MEDAFVLGEELARATDVTAALRAFHARRHPRVREVVRIALGNSRRMATGERRPPASESMYKFLASPP